jgi:hypothetical protein
MRSHYSATALVMLAMSPLMLSACDTSEDVDFVNPTAETVFVQVNQDRPFAVAPGTSVTASVPSFERLRPVTITARNERGDVIFFTTMSTARLAAEGHRVELVTQGERIDPLAPAPD